MVDEERYKIINGDSLKVLDTIEPNSIDAIITDPPYGLVSITKRFGKPNSAPCKDTKENGPFVRVSKGFMGKEWDGSGIEYNVELWAKALRVLKPGGFLLAFGGTRTFHRIACAIEDAGFEIRDTIMWLYGSGFPKSMNIGLMLDKKNGVESQVMGIKEHCKKDFKINNLYAQDEANKNNTKCFGYGTQIVKKATNEWSGWGTALKPAYEPIIVARKPVEKSVLENVEKYGVGGINIDECRVGDEIIKGGTMPDLDYVGKEQKKNGNGHKLSFGQVENAPRIPLDEHQGRFPSNVILTYDETDEKEVCGGMPETKSTGGSGEASQINTFSNVKMGVNGKNTGAHLGGLGDEGSAARYFYCAKASKKDRDSGLEKLESKMFHRMRPDADENNPTGLNTEGRFAPVLRKNIHPTVKPVELMQYLVRLVTPKGGTVLDIFNGSGSTGKAVAFENRERDADYKYIGIELDPEYCEISKGRIDYAINKYVYDMVQDIKEEEKGQVK